MKYVLLIYGEEPTGEVGQEESAREMAAYADYTRDMVERGAFIAGEALAPTPTATTVRVQGDRTLTTDGPFAETKEALGGFYMVEAKDLDEAIEWAARIPGARRGSIEVRPVWELPAEYQEAVGDPRIQALSN